MGSDQPVGAEVVAEVRRVFRDGLLSGRSAFAPETDAWTEATASDLRARFVDRPDESSDTFMVKLRRQLDGAPAATVVLAAELLFVNMAPLVPEQIGLRKKLQILGEVLSWAGLARLASPERMERGLKGFLHGGQGFLNYRWAQFQILVLLVERLASLPHAERDVVLGDPWRFREECLDVQRSVGHKKGRAQIHVLLYSLFPEVFQPIASAYHKQEIVKAFTDELSDVTGDDDRDLLELRKILQARSGEPVRFYADPWVGRWRRGAVEHEQRGWLVRGFNVEGRNFIPAWIRQGYCSVSWREMPELPAGAEKREIQRAVAEAMPDASAQLRAQAVYQLHVFLTVMRPGDLVVTVTPDEVHVGTVQGPASYDLADGLDNARRRQVRWATAEKPLVRAELPEKVQARLPLPPTVYDISSVAAELAERAGLENVVAEELADADVTKPLELPPVTT
ncbi:AAA family ATPase, partial [Streptomyces sp. ND04-05B]|nr:AAA family ATPase [Streptomyces sp. ND04-05B]